MISSWVEGADGSDYSVAVLPMGVAVLPANDAAHVVTRIGDQVLDLYDIAMTELATEHLRPLLTSASLNSLLAAGRPVWTQLRASLTTWLSDPTYRDRVAPHLHPTNAVRMVMPFDVARLRRLLLLRAARAKRRRHLQARLPRPSRELEAPTDRLSRPSRHRRGQCHRHHPPPSSAESRATLPIRRSVPRPGSTSRLRWGSWWGRPSVLGHPCPAEPSPTTCSALSC